MQASSIHEPIGSLRPVPTVVGMRHGEDLAPVAPVERGCGSMAPKAGRG